MGQRNTVFEKLPQEIKNNYQATQNPAILKCKNQQSLLYLRSYKHYHQIKSQSLSYYRSRTQLDPTAHQNLVVLAHFQINALSQQQKTFSCTMPGNVRDNGKVINFLHQYHASRLQTQIMNRHNSPFSEKQIWSVIFSSVIGAYTLVKNDFKQPILSPKAIMITEQGYIKVGQWEFVNEQQNYEQCESLLNSQGNKSILMNYYWAPEGPAIMQETLSIVFCGSRKRKDRNSQLFCLGMTVLEMILRKPLYQLLTLSERQIEMYIQLAINKRIAQKKQLSSKLIQVLKKMLCWDYNGRVKYQQLYNIFIGMFHNKKGEQTQNSIQMQNAMLQSKVMMEQTFGQSLDISNRLGTTICLNFEDSKLGSNEGDDAHPFQQNLDLFVQDIQMNREAYDKEQKQVAQSYKMQNSETNKNFEKIFIDRQLFDTETKDKNTVKVSQFKNEGYLHAYSSICNTMPRDRQQQIDLDFQQFICQVDEENIDKFQVDEWVQEDGRHKLSACSSQISFKQQNFFNIPRFVGIQPKEAYQKQAIQVTNPHVDQSNFQLPEFKLQFPPTSYNNSYSLRVERQKQQWFNNKVSQQSKQNFKGIINRRYYGQRLNDDPHLFTDEKLIDMIRSPVKQEINCMYIQQKQSKSMKQPQIRIQDRQIQVPSAKASGIYRQSVAKGYYQGQKSHGVRNGFGTFYYSEGGKYIGHWLNNQMNGRGTLYYPDNTIAYEGMWKDDELHGIGTLYNENPSKIHSNMGFFDYTNFDECQQCWARYSGQFKNDDKDGKGQLVLSNGQRFVGNFKNDFVDGSGVFFRKDGSKVIGYWSRNQMIEGSTQRPRSY